MALPEAGTVSYFIHGTILGNEISLGQHATALASPDVEVRVSDLASKVRPGQRLEYNVVVKNKSNTDVVSAALVDSLSSHLSDVTWVRQGGFPPRRRLFDLPESEATLIDPTLADKQAAVSSVFAHR